ncbi:erbin isoform X5 [Peromyscus eremicus]|uniref:erbin isoform X5 n=1 Tax=Peromyscus eremicus TaxID=42410 RepID=UPI0027DB0810|nr:erbin isoform X5 [Peromyscus eremicus]
MTTKRSLFVRLVPCRCLRGEEETVTTLDYSHCSLEQVPKEIFTFEKTLEELYLDANQIEELPKQLFNCQSLHKLSLPDNDLTTLPASIANLINLRELDVSKNGIQEFPENIKNCKVLTIVEASVNPISKLPDGFSQLLNLTQLYLNDAFLEFLPANFGRLTKLQILELRENQLKMLPKTMNRLTQLERLDLGSNEFTEVPEVLEQLSGLKEFWMDGNRLTFIPGFIGSLRQLTYLDVSKNNIEMVEEGISTCENLQDFLLSSNSLQHLPETIGSLKNVTTLKIDENQLMYLPDSIGGLRSIEELDCSFNEIEALPSSIGQLINIRTFAADHNYLQQLPPEIGNWKNITVLFLHSNKLETLPEEMGDMQKLKVINLSDNRLKNLPFSFTKLQQLTAMWLSDNQSKPLIPLQKETDSEAQKTVLTNYMFPQQPRTEDVMFISDNESFNPALWEEQRKQRAQVAFECDEDKDEREAPPREGNLKRYPTPYPDELKNMVKTVQTIVHRLKDEETNDESGRDMKHEDQQVVNQDMGVKASESTTVKSKLDEREKYMNSVQKPREPEAETSPGNVPVTANMKVSGNLKHIVNHDDVFEESEELSSDEEMKMAEMRPPLIETSINQPKVVALSNNKKDDAKDTDSLSDEVTHNSNQNNSNCSSPSRMSDSVSLNTDSSQDTSLCSPVKQTPIDSNSKIRQEDENFNSLLQNGDILNSSPEEKFRVNDKKDFKLPEYDLNIEERLVLIEKDDSKVASDESHQLDHINMNLNKLVTNNTFQPEIKERSKTQDIGFLSSHSQSDAQHTENGNKYPNLESINKINGLSEEVAQSAGGIEPQNCSSADVSISKSTEDLSPQRSGPVGSVVKSHSITNMETGGLKICDILSDDDPQAPSAAVKITSAVDGKNIVRSKSATLLYDQPLQVFTASSSSSDLMAGTKALFKFDSNHNPEEPDMLRAPTVTGPQSTPQLYGPPQYNVQYSGTAAGKDSLWHPKQNPQLDPVSFPPQRLPRSESAENHSYAKNSANMNFSNHNNVRASTAYHLHQRLAPARHGEMWAISPNDRLVPTGTRPAVQRQSSVSSTASINLGDPGLTRRTQISEGDYLSYRELHSVGRTPMMSGSQRPLSARAYSIDGPNTSRPQSARPSVNEIPERTMSVSDFNYSRTSPSKRPNARVGSEHSLLDPPGKSKVPHDWREQVLRHIEAKKLEKMPLSNGQMGQPLRPQANYSQIHHPPQASVARHPSREQLIDYLMLKVAHQPPYTHPHCSPRQGHELAKQEIRVRVEKDPELGFSISGGVGGRGNPFRPDDDGIFVTRVQPEGPASKLLQPGDKIIQANGYSFINIEHGQAVSLLKTFQNTVELIIVREVSS